MSFIGIMAKNRIEWMILDLANIMNRNTTVPFYDTYKTDVIQHILEKTNLETLFCAADVIEKLIQIKGTKLKNIVSFDPFTEEIRRKCQDNDYKLFDLNYVMNFGENYKNEEKK